MPPKPIKADAEETFRSIVSYALQIAPRGLESRSLAEAQCRIEDPAFSLHSDYVYLKFCRGDARVEVRIGWDSSLRYDESTVDFEGDTFIKRRLQSELAVHGCSRFNPIQALLSAELLADVARFAGELASVFDGTYHQLLVSKEQKAEQVEARARAAFNVAATDCAKRVLKGKRKGFSATFDPSDFGLQEYRRFFTTEPIVLMDGKSTYSVVFTPTGGLDEFEGKVERVYDRQHSDLELGEG